jgi:hypothetical protein
MEEFTCSFSVCPSEACPHRWPQISQHHRFRAKAITVSSLSIWETGTPDGTFPHLFCMDMKTFRPVTRFWHIVEP